MGDTVNLTQRLQQLASAGETVISEPTKNALSLDLDVVELDAQLVKGRDTPVVAYKILALTRDEEPSFSSASEGDTP